MTKTSPATDHLRPAGRATRAAIEEAARTLFAERGFERASVRAIAAEAGVDPALVIRHFGSKEALFLRTVDTSLGLGSVLEGPIETVGRRLVAYFVDPGRPVVRKRFVALAQAAHRDQVREEMVRHTAETYVAPLTPRLTGADRELRAALAVAQIGGLLTMLYVQEDPILAAADPADLIAIYGDAIQRLLTPEAAE
ncbi:TetR family transcriptional regulator [Nocardioides sp. WV_118_6]|uniref:TetR/AcrR family transcriptional regulator n=1 Tax=Pimelobacter TaxID=2044 RepID=UPI001C0574E3|nr:MULTISPECIES: TetR family transcriptional regulator [Pimelobacter]UUW87296.1 TetR family transcriptional regulator [Pimelobacter simplex]UUW96802.1 TetR family transcriptional regulator [Pimelobacter simplex]